MGEMRGKNNSVSAWLTLLEDLTIADWYQYQLI